MKPVYPLISVIIPLYNRQQYIIRALDSILAEDYPNIEIVVLDDGSTDTSKAVVEAWIAKHPETLFRFRSRPNRGFIPTLNELIRMSQGEYIVLLDSDDYLLNNGIRRRYDYLQAHPEKLLVFSDCLLIDQDDNIVSESALSEIGKVDKSKLSTDYELRKFAVLNGFTTGSTIMADRRVYELIGPYDESLHSQDYVYHIKVAAKNHYGFVDGTVSAYRIHPQNMSSSYTQVKVVIENFWAMIENLKDYPELEFKYYLLINAFRDLIRIPYLFVKFTLMNMKKNPNLKNSWLMGPVNALLFLMTAAKNLSCMITANLYLKKTS